MYDINLSESHFPAQGGPAAAPVTIGEMLRASAKAAPDRAAMKELGYDGAVGRVWSYAELLNDVERLGRAWPHAMTPARGLPFTRTTFLNGCCWNLPALLLM